MVHGECNAAVECCFGNEWDKRCGGDKVAIMDQAVLVKLRVGAVYCICVQHVGETHLVVVKRLCGECDVVVKCWSGVVWCESVVSERWGYPQSWYRECRW